MPMAYKYIASSSLRAHRLCGEAARDYVQVIQKVSDGTVEIRAPGDWARDNSALFRQEQHAPRPQSHSTRKMLWCVISLGGSLEALDLEILRIVLWAHSITDLVSGVW